MSRKFPFASLSDTSFLDDLLVVYRRTAYTIDVQITDNVE